MAAYSFQPTPLQNFSFQPTLDGTTYLVTVWWNVYRQDWFITIVDQGGNVIVTRALVGSPPARPLASLVWDENRMVVNATTADPHNFRIGSVVELTLAGNVPAAFNGSFRCGITGARTFSYSLSTDPGDMTSAGLAAFAVNLVQGYFTSSIMIFDDQASQFIVEP